VDTAVAPDVFTSFEFNAAGPFDVGTTPFRATFSNGNAESRGVPEFYITGANSWHILIGTSATVTFETNPQTLSFWVRTENATDVSEILINDENGALIQMIVPTNAFQNVVMSRSAGETDIGSVEVTSTSGGDVVIDDFTFGYAITTDSVGCLVTETNEFVCLISDGASDDPIAGAQGTLTLANGNEVSGTGRLYALPGETLADGSTVADLTITAGTVSEGVSFGFSLTAAGQTSTGSTSYDDDYERGSDLATVAAVYTTFSIFGSDSSFTIDATGVISGQSAAGCVLSGQVNAIDALFNAYDVQLDVASCGGMNGTYDGLGLTVDEAATDDRFVFPVFTNQDIVVGVADK